MGNRGLAVQDEGDRDRLLTELARGQARERATRTILDIISRSRDDEAPVFAAILENACALCDAPLAGLILGTPQDAAQRLAAHRGMLPAAMEMFARGEMRMDGDLSYAARSIIEGCTIAFDDMKDSALYRAGSPVVRAMVDDSGIRSVLFVPLVRDGAAIGNLTLFRRAVDPFDAASIALVETFAAQAVIAIENVHQFREVQDRLERETASSRILHVISQSRDDEGPVFAAILESAARLCAADQATLQLVNAERTRFNLAAGWGLDRTAFPIGHDWPLAGDQPVPSAILSGQCVGVDDFRDTAAYRDGDPVVRRIADEEGVRTRLAVPLMRDGVALGTITLSRREVRPFSTSHIQLVETFAAQAVIAIENVRQFKALEALNAELGARVDAQVGEIERMGRLKRFLPAAVADAVVSSGSEDMLSSHRAMLGVLFCDIRGFTAFCETAEPEETIEVLQTYHQEMGRLINDHGAGVDHRMGDGIMVIFNDPLPCDDPAGEAVRLAVAMRARMAELCRVWRRMGYRLGFGVGVSLGYATVGMVGYEGRSDYTASGTAVNLAARLCDMAADGEILLSTRAAIAVEDAFATETTGAVTLKGIREPVEIFRLVEAPDV